MRRQFFGVPIEQLLLIGDSLNDALAARAAGCPVFCVPYGYNHGEPVDRLDLDAVIANLSAALPLDQNAFEHETGKPHYALEGTAVAMV